MGRAGRHPAGPFSGLPVAWRGRAGQGKASRDFLLLPPPPPGACRNQYLTTAALKLTHAAPAVTMSFLSVVWSMLLDLLVFHDPPGLLSLLGAAIVGASSWLVVRAEQARSRGGGGGGRAQGMAARADEEAAAGEGEQAALLARGKLQRSSRGRGGAGAAEEEGELEMIEAGQTQSSRGSPAPDASQLAAGAAANGPPPRGQALPLADLPGTSGRAREEGGQLRREEGGQLRHRSASPVGRA